MSAGVHGVGRGASPAGFEAEVIEHGEAFGPELDALAFEALDALDESDGARAHSEALARLAGTTRTVDDAVAAPAPEHVARALAAGRAGEALARVARRGARPGESAEEQRMRALVARLLDLRHEAAAGMGKVSVG